MFDSIDEDEDTALWAIAERCGSFATAPDEHDLLGLPSSDEEPFEKFHVHSRTGDRCGYPGYPSYPRNM